MAKNWRDATKNKGLSSIIGMLFIVYNYLNGFIAWYSWFFLLIVIYGKVFCCLVNWSCFFFTLGSWQWRIFTSRGAVCYSFGRFGFLSLPFPLVSGGFRLRLVPSWFIKLLDWCCCSLPDWITNKYGAALLEPYLKTCSPAYLRSVIASSSSLSVPAKGRPYLHSTYLPTVHLHLVICLGASGHWKVILKQMRWMQSISGKHQGEC